MDDASLLDRFTDTFVTYIDSGFGLLSGEVAFLTTILVVIDITLAGLFWAWGHDSDVMARLIRKVLYVGFFALLLNNFQALTGIVFDSFAGLGLRATATGLTADDLLRPGFVAGTGFEAAHPILEAAGDLFGFSAIWNSENVITIVILMFAWLVVVLAFFILAVQLFITIIEFKLTTLAGFVLVPFALWNKTAFLAERVLGNVVSAGIKVMVLAVIVGIGTTIFGDFTTALDGEEVTLAAAMSLVLGSIALLGLGVFGPGIAAGLVSGAPQLGAGAAVGTVGGLAAGGVAAGSLAAGAMRAGAAATGGAVRAASSVAGGAGAAYGLGRATSGAAGLAGVAAGLGGVARAGSGAAVQGVRSLGRRASGGMRESATRGAHVAWTATGGRPLGASSGSASVPQTGGDNAPAWARRLRAEQRLRHGAATAQNTIREGDRPGQAANPELRERDE